MVLRLLLTSSVLVTFVAFDETRNLLTFLPHISVCPLQAKRQSNLYNFGLNSCCCGFTCAEYTA